MEKFRTYQMAVEFNQACQGIKLKAPYKNQFERAVLSIALNLAEGSAKSSKADRKKFYEIALGSLRETQAIIKMLNLHQIRKQADDLGGSLFVLCRSLSR